MAWDDNVIDGMNAGNNSATTNSQQNTGPEPFTGVTNNNNKNNQSNDFSLTNLLSRLDTQVSLSERGMEYHKALREGLEDSSWRFKLKCERLSEQAYLFHDNNRKGVIIVYTEMNLNDNESALRMYSKARSLAYELFGTQILNVIGIHTEDYDKVGVMITDIKNTFITDSPEFKNFTVEDLKKNKFGVDQNVEKVKNFVKAVSPHGVPAAFDIGFLINVMVNKEKNTQFVINNNNHQNNNFEPKPIAAVLGKVNFICNYNSNIMMSNFGGNQHIFLPNIVITDIVSPIKLPSLIPFFISMAYQVFIGYGGWKNCFKQFGVKGAMNIGNLMEDQNTHMLVNVTNDADVEAFISNFCKTPILTIAVNDGRSRIPGLEYFATSENIAVAASNISNFLLRPISNDRVVAAYTPECVGTTTIKGELCDSRYIDYLRIVAENPNEAVNVRSLLMNYIDPFEKYKFISNIAPDISPVKYTAFGCALCSDLLANISNAMSNISVGIDCSNTNQFFDNNALMNESSNYANMQVNRFGTFNNFANYNYNGFFGYKM